MKIVGEAGDADKNKEKGLKADKWAKIELRNRLARKWQKSVGGRRGVPVGMGVERSDEKGEKKLYTATFNSESLQGHPQIVFPMLSF